MTNDKSEEVVHRLGGRSKIDQLFELLQDLRESLSQRFAHRDKTIESLREALVKEAAQNRIRVGARLRIHDYSTAWSGSDLLFSHPKGLYEIVALGENWVVIRRCYVDQSLLDEHGSDAECTNRLLSEVWFRSGYRIEDDLVHYLEDEPYVFIEPYVENG